MKRSLRRLFLFAILLSACREVPPPEPTVSRIMPQPLASFRQVLTSPTTQLRLHPKEEVRLPVRIQNPGVESWASEGRFPVTISYKWYKAGAMLPIEGERTVLPSPLGPNQAVEVPVRVLAPDQTGGFALRVTLVQEGVAWFMLKSNTFLELPVTVR